LEYNIISEESKVAFKIEAKTSALIDFLLLHRLVFIALCFKKILINLINPLTHILQTIDIDLLNTINNIQSF